MQFLLSSQWNRVARGPSDEYGFLGPFDLQIGMRSLSTSRLFIMAILPYGGFDTKYSSALSMKKS
jgi:hypothetical protein